MDQKRLVASFMGQIDRAQHQHVTNQIGPEFWRIQLRFTFLGSADAVVFRDTKIVRIGATDQ